MASAVADGDGDVLVLPVPHPAGGRRTERGGADFGKPLGRGVTFGKGGAEETVGHALRADVPDGAEATVDEDAAVGRRRERVARMMARLPRRGPGQGLTPIHFPAEHMHFLCGTVG